MATGKVVWWGEGRKKAESLDIVWSKAVLQCGEQGALEQSWKRQGRFPTKEGWRAFLCYRTRRMAETPTGLVLSHLPYSAKCQNRCTACARCPDARDGQN